MLNIQIRAEHSNDFEAIEGLIRNAFTKSELGYSGEAELVGRIRETSAYIPKLALVATLKGRVVGHILLSRIKIKGLENSFQALALAPVSVLPECQNNGIGSKLIIVAHRIAKLMSEKYIVLVGHADYYPKFGYQRCDQFGIKLPFDAPKENCLIYFLQDFQNEDISGLVEYHSVFME